MDFKSKNPWLEDFAEKSFYKQNSQLKASTCMYYVWDFTVYCIVGGLAGPVSCLAVIL